MFKTLLIKEFMGMILDRKYLVYFCLVTVLAVAGFAVRVSVYRDKQNNYQTLRNTFTQELQAATSPQQIATGNLKVAVPPQPLQTLATGTANQFSEFTNISLAFWNNEPYPFLRTERYTNPALGIFPALDLPLLVLFVISLMVLVFSHSTVSRERESGTLRLMLSYRVPRAKVILAKTVSGYLVTAFPVMFSLVCILLTAQLIPTFGFNGRGLLLAAALGALSLLYLLVLYLLGVFVSTVCNRSSTAIAVLLLIWLVFIVVTHNAAILAYERTATGTSVARVLREKNRLGGTSDLFMKIDAERKKILGLKKDEQIDWKKVTIVQQIKMGRAFITVANNEITSTVTGYINGLEKNYRMLTFAGFASPSLLYLSAATELAGTGVSAHIRTVRSLVDYQQHMAGQILALFDRQLESASRGEPNKETDVKAFIEDLGEYRAPRTSPGQAWKTILPQALVLCVYAVLFFMMGFTAFIKKDVT